MASLTFVGAAGTVTGSKHLLSIDGKHLFVDCGLFQGVEDVRALNNVPLPIDASAIDAVLITQGHLDHVGYLPKLVRDGFSGPIYCTPPTQAVMDIVLNDAAHLQEEFHRRGLNHDHPHAPPDLFYDEDDVVHTLQRVRPVALGTAFDVAGVRATYHNAGHILGSAFIALQLDGRRVIFSGDLGRYDRPLLYDPEAIGNADAIVCESTYGDRNHPPDSTEALRQALLEGMQRGGAIVIPAFAVERTQDILLAIAGIQAREPRLAELPVHLDSPMAEKVDALFSNFPDAHRLIAHDSTKTPFGINHLFIHQTTDESKRLNDVTGPHVIISSSGMASGGRILHHLHNHIPDSTATIVFVGYQSAGTLGNLLVHGTRHVRIYGDTLPVHATIVELAGFSAHADQSDIKRWFETCPSRPHLFAVHGEPQSAAALATLANATYGWKADVAKRNTTVEL